MPEDESRPIRAGQAPTGSSLNKMWVIEKLTERVLSMRAPCAVIVLNAVIRPMRVDNSELNIGRPADVYFFKLISPKRPVRYRPPTRQKQVTRRVQLAESGPSTAQALRPQLARITA